MIKTTQVAAVRKIHRRMESMARPSRGDGSVWERVAWLKMAEALEGIDPLRARAPVALSPRRVAES